MAEISEQLIEEPWDEYVKSRGNYLTSHMLGDFHKCPVIYRDKHVTGEKKDQDSPAYRIGRATHTLILEEEEKFNEEYVVSDGPVNPKTDKPYGSTSQKFLDWVAEQKSQGLDPVSTSEYEAVYKMWRSVLAHAEASQILSNGVPERVIRSEMNGMKTQSRLDWWSDKYGIADLKTCEDLDRFEFEAKKWGYVYQFAFYREQINIEFKIQVPVHIIAVEKSYPFRTAVYQLNSGDLSDATEMNYRKIEKLQKCMISNEWPTGYEELRELKLFN